MDITSMITNAMILCRGTLELYLFSITDCLSPSDEQHGDRQADTPQEYSSRPNVTGISTNNCAAADAESFIFA